MSDYVARRGGKPLNADELRGHVALVSRLENVGVFLGSGASVSAGGVTVGDLWRKFCDDHADSAQWLVDERFVTAQDIAKGGTVDVERLLDQLQSEEAVLARRRENTPADDTGDATGGQVGDAAEDTDPVATLVRHRDNLYREVLRAANLIELDRWQRPGSIGEHEGLALHRKLLQRLVGGRQPGQPAPWVFTTNYDLAVEWAAESQGLHVVNGFSGVHFRSFAPANFDLGYRSTSAHGQAQFGTYNVYLAKLHGSLSWQHQEGELPHELTCQAIEPTLSGFLGGSREWPALMVYPSASKFAQTGAFVLGEMFRRFADYLLRPQACLFVNGYSFRDEHINRVLSTALHNPTLQLVLFVPEAKIDDEGAIKWPDEGEPTYTAPDWLKAIIGADHPQVTIVVGTEHAYFEPFVEQLPEPALVDEFEQRTKALMKLLAGATSTARRTQPEASPQGNE